MAAGEVELRCRINVCGTIWAEGNDWGQFGEVRSKTGCVKKGNRRQMRKVQPSIQVTRNGRLVDRSIRQGQCGSGRRPEMDVRAEARYGGWPETVLPAHGGFLET